MTRNQQWGELLIAGMLLSITPCLLRSQMNVNPYFTAINYPIAEHSIMTMALPDFQSARYGDDFFTGMLMAEYGLTERWTIGLMTEGQKIANQSVTYGGMRLNTYIHVIEDEQYLNLTLYGEYEDLNGAALYKMEVAGFGSGDLTETLSLARQTRVRTFEQRVIFYYDVDRLNLTFNFIRETALQSPHKNDYGFALGLFFRPTKLRGATEAMAGMTATPTFSFDRLGYGVEYIGALGDDQRFGFDWNAQQQYLGAVLNYDLSSGWSLRLEPAFGLSKVSDHFVLRTGVAYMFALYGPEVKEQGHDASQ